ncbi:MAG TPA: hypothetical protein PKD96_04055 [Candidatus Absconditabacterales bacterium]|nr:hypothetical protein [Candidatus Absconditabacterales bacterium]HMT27454.1 hypothetical protein [Candidatus Absconditabacterales bacterium]
MKKFIKNIFIWSLFSTLFFINGVFAQNTGTNPFSGNQFQGRFDAVMGSVVSPLIGNALNAGIVTRGARGVADLMLYIGIKIIIPIAIVVGILIGFLGFYTLMSSSDKDGIKKGTNYLVGGVVGTILMVSAQFIGNTLFEQIVGQGTSNTFIGVATAEKLYTLLLYPFIKLALFLVVGLLFVILLIHAFRFILSPSDKIKGHARTIIIYNTIGILLLIGSQSIVEAIYGKRTEVTNPSINGNVASLGDIGSSVIEDRDFSFAYEIINRAMSFILLVILILIIVQTIQLLANPDSEDKVSKIRNSLIYGFMGIILIGAGYLVTNFVIITP